MKHFTRKAVVVAGLAAGALMLAPAAAQAGYPQPSGGGGGYYDIDTDICNASNSGHDINVLSDILSHNGLLGVGGAGGGGGDTIRC